MKQHFTVIGVGSNILPERHVPMAVNFLNAVIPDLICSPTYQSPAFGFNGNVFHNTGVMGHALLDLKALEQHLKQIEQSMGHDPSLPSKQNRVIDLDVYLFGEQVSDTLPRDDIVQYPFAAQILCDLIPNGVHPINKISYCQLAHDLKADQWLQKL